MTVTYLPIEVLADGKPLCVVDVPSLTGAAEAAKAERRALWTIIAQGQYEPEQITVRYAPEYQTSYRYLMEHGEEE